MKTDITRHLSAGTMILGATIIFLVAGASYFNTPWNVPERPITHTSGPDTDTNSTPNDNKHPKIEKTNTTTPSFTDQPILPNDPNGILKAAQTESKERLLAAKTKKTQRSEQPLDWFNVF